jgi:hypothetical protein
MVLPVKFFEVIWKKLTAAACAVVTLTLPAVTDGLIPINKTNKSDRDGAFFITQLQYNACCKKCKGKNETFLKWPVLTTK